MPRVFSTFVPTFIHIGYILNSTIDAIERWRLPRRWPSFFSARLAGLALTAAAVVALE
jgi:hypothetical protein